MDLFNSLPPQVQDQCLLMIRASYMAQVSHLPDNMSRVRHLMGTGMSILDAVKTLKVLGLFTPAPLSTTGHFQPAGFLAEQPSF